MASLQISNTRLFFGIVCVFAKCRGVPFVSNHRSQRMNAIASTLSKADYDVVVLQEVWTDMDYELLCRHILPQMPFTHYFRSGNCGSGVCIFSKHMICETFQYKFELNGYAHKIFHCDWFGEKSVGLAKIKLQDFVVNVYGTHLHAQYNEPDEYEAHRVAQSFELAQFIRHTSDACDAVIVAGDFNFRPDQLGYKVIQSVGNLEDSWITGKAKTQSDDEGNTCLLPENVYSPPAECKKHPKGVRIDYIMYRSNSGAEIVCDKSHVTMQKVTDEPYHYSDHEGVTVSFVLKKNVTAMGKSRELGNIEKHLLDVLSVIDKGIQKTKSARVFYLVGLLLSIVTFVFITSIQIPQDMAILSVFLEVGQVAVTGYALFCLWMGVIMTGREMNALINVEADVNNTLKATSMYQF